MNRTQGSLVTLLAMVALSGLPSCAAKTKTRQPRVAVTVATAERRDMPIVLRSSGTVEAIQNAAVGSQVGGVVVRVAFHEGDEVRKGQLLIQLDPRPFRAALHEAQAALARSRAQSESARLDAARARALVDRQMVSQMEWDQKRTGAAAAAAAVRADSAAVEKARLDLDYSSIRSPLSGRTGRLLVHEGDYVKAGTAEALVSVNQSRPVRVAFTVPTDAVTLVQRYRSQAPKVWVETGDSVGVVGKLAFVDNAVDPGSGTLLLKGEFPNHDGRLVPGQLVDVRLVLAVQPGATVVPAPAVSRGQAGAFVYVVNRDSTVTPRPVQVSRTVDEMAIVSFGLQAGEQVVTDGQLRLSPGARVLVRSGATQ